MVELDIDDVEPGMTLASDLLTPGGQPLLAAGVAITDKLLVMLERRDIARLSVSAPSQSEEQQETLELTEEQRTQLQKLFSFTDAEHPLIKRLYTLCESRMIRLQPGGIGHEN